MTRRAMVMIAAVIALGGLVAPSWPQEASQATSGRKFLFRYEASRPLAYSVITRMKVDMTLKVGADSTSTKTSVGLRYRLNLTPTSDSSSGVSTMRLQQSNLEGDWDIAGPDGHIVLSLCGTEMTGTRDGVLVIDTAKDIGVARAQDFKKEMMPLYLSGQVDLDPRGNVKQFRGDPPFVEFWTQACASQVGMWGIVFPERAIAIGDAWEESLSMKRVGQVKFDGEGLSCKVVFTRQPDVIVGGKPQASFSVSAPFVAKDLTGCMEGLGDNIRLKVPLFERSTSGTVRFDPERGVLTEHTSRAGATSSAEAIVQGRSVTVSFKMQIDISVKLLGGEAKTVQQ